MIAVDQSGCAVVAQAALRQWLPHLNMMYDRSVNSQLLLCRALFVPLTQLTPCRPLQIHTYLCHLCSSPPCPPAALCPDQPVHRVRVTGGPRPRHAAGGSSSARPQAPARGRRCWGWWCPACAAGCGGHLPAVCCCQGGCHPGHLSHAGHQKPAAGEAGGGWGPHAWAGDEGWWVGEGAEVTLMAPTTLPHRLCHCNSWVLTGNLPPATPRRPSTATPRRACSTRACGTPYAAWRLQRG